MQTFEYHIASDVSSAISLVSQNGINEFIAGGTSEVDLLKENVQRPDRLIDISKLPLTGIDEIPGGRLRIGANVKNAILAKHPLIRSIYPAISEALLAGASQQIRNMASTAGNLLQRTRCPYLRDTNQPCNKRDPGTGCAAVTGFNRIHAIFGQNDEGPTSAFTCIATHPSDLAVALAAHRAIILIEGKLGSRQISFEELHRLPGKMPHIDTNLQKGDLIIGVELPSFSGNSHYLKVRDRASFAYSLVTCAVAISWDDHRIGDAQIVLGSVAHKPWRLYEAEKLLIGQLPGRDLFQKVAEKGLEGAQTYAMNNYKPKLARAIIRRALLEVSGIEPLQGPAGTVFSSSVGGIAGTNNFH